MDKLAEAMLDSFSVSDEIKELLEMFRKKKYKIEVSCWTSHYHDNITLRFIIIKKDGEFLNLTRATVEGYRKKEKMQWIVKWFMKGKWERSYVKSSNVVNLGSKYNISPIEASTMTIIKGR